MTQRLSLIARGGRAGGEAEEEEYPIEEVIVTNKQPQHKLMPSFKDAMSMLGKRD